MGYVIAQVIGHGEAVKEFRLRRQDGATLPDWQPGAHIVLHFTAADGSPLERHYSLIGAAGAADTTDTTDAADAADTAATYRVAVQREDGGKGGSRRLHDAYAPGSAIEVSGPFNSFPLHTASMPGARTLLVAGGIGITPLISMAHALSAAGQPFELHYLARSAARLVLLDELRAIPHATIVTHLSDQDGHADLNALLGAYRDGDSLYACGPAPLLQGLAAAGAQCGWPSGALHFESFGARTQQQDGPLTVELSLSGITVEVQPGTSILDALLAADAFVSYDCKRGECGNCYTPVRQGQPLHRDVCLTPAMRDAGMCTCVSWAAAPGHLVLEL